MYLDDVPIGDDLDNILHIFSVIKKAKVLGLSLNNEKTEIICKDATVRGIGVGTVAAGPAMAATLFRPEN